MHPTDQHLRWRKSSRSGNGANCVEIAFDADIVHTRDSKNRSGPSLAFPRSGWTAFITSTKSQLENSA